MKTGDKIKLSEGLIFKANELQQLKKDIALKENESQKALIEENAELLTDTMLQALKMKRTLKRLEIELHEAVEKEYPGVDCFDNQIDTRTMELHVGQEALVCIKDHLAGKHNHKHPVEMLAEALGAKVIKLG